MAEPHRQAPLLAPSDRPSPRAWAGAALFALCGAGLLVWLILRSDPAKLWRAFERGAAWLPLLAAIEAVRVAIEAWGGRKLYATAIPYSLLLRASYVAYAVAALAPAGRATGEAVKAGLLRKYTCLSDTAAAGIAIQICSFLALGLWSVVCAGVALGVSLPLAGALALQAGVVLAGAAAVSGALHTAWLGRLLGRFFPRAGTALESVRRDARRQSLRAPLAALIASRGLELVQYTVIFVAIEHRFAIVPSLLSFGVATLAGSIGDSIPAQLGAIDASFTTAASGIGVSREDALAFALLAHGFQMTWIVVGLVTPLVWRPGGRTAAAVNQVAPGPDVHEDESSCRGTQ